MHTTFNFFLAVVSLLTGAALPLSASQGATLTNSATFTGNSQWGTSQVESYDVAIHIPASLAGKQVTYVSFPTPAGGEATDCRVWLSENLSLSDNIFTPDLAGESVTPSDGRITLTLSTPAEIGAEGLYAGISFIINAKDSEAQKQPVVTIKGEDLMGFGMRIHTSKTYKKWTDGYKYFSKVPVVEIGLANLPEAAASLTLPEEINVAAGSAHTLSAVLTNYGSSPVNSAILSFSCEAGSGDLPVTFSSPVPALYGMPTQVEITLPAFADKGRYNLSMKVKEVNGTPNSLSEESASTMLYVLSSLPVHRPLFEEYTGTGCGYCPRGAIGMEKMREEFGDEFIGVAYHSEDVMSVIDDTDFPNPAPSLPTAYIDRYISTDPYFGLEFDINKAAESDFETGKIYAAEASRFTPLHLGLTSDWTDDTHEAISVQADYRFVKEYSDADFRFTLLLVADELKGDEDDAEWAQDNYYAGEKGKWPAAFDYLVNSPVALFGYTFEDVVIYTTGAISGSVPTTIEADKPLTFTRELKLADAVNLKGKSLVQDKSKLRVIAVVTDLSTGRVLNAAASRPGVTTVATLAGSEAEVIAERWYDLLGRCIDPAQHRGIALQVLSYSDGTTLTRKVMR